MLSWLRQVERKADRLPADEDCGSLAATYQLHSLFVACPAIFNHKHAVDDAFPVDILDICIKLALPFF